MIKMSYEQLSSMNFQRAMSKLMNTPMKSPEAFKIKHIGKALQKNQTEMTEKFKKEIIAVFAKGGEETKEPVSEVAQKAGIPFEPLEGKLEATKEAIEQFGKREFTIPQNKITAQYLISCAEWTPVELQFLEPVVSELTAVETQLELPFPQN